MTNEEIEKACLFWNELRYECLVKETALLKLSRSLESFFGIVKLPPGLVIVTGKYSVYSVSRYFVSTEGNITILEVGKTETDGMEYRFQVPWKKFSYDLGNKTHEINLPPKAIMDEFIEELNRYHNNGTT